MFAVVKRRRSAYASVLTGFDPPPNDDLIIQFGYVLEARLKKARMKAGLGSRSETLVASGCRSGQGLRGKDGDLDPTACFARLPALAFVDELLFSQTYQVDSVDWDIVRADEVRNHRVGTLPAQLIIISGRSSLIREAFDGNKVALQ